MEKKFTGIENRCKLIKGDGMIEIRVSPEEYAHIQMRREAVKKFNDFCKRKLPDNEHLLAVDMERQEKQEQFLMQRWGIEV